MQGLRWVLLGIFFTKKNILQESEGDVVRAEEVQVGRVRALVEEQADADALAL